MCQGPGSSLDGVFYGSEKQKLQVPQKRQDETLPGQTQVEGKTTVVSIFSQFLF